MLHPLLTFVGLNWYRRHRLDPKEYHSCLSEGKSHQQIRKCRCVSQQDSGLSESGPILLESTITPEDYAHRGSCT